MFLRVSRGIRSHPPPILEWAQHAISKNWLISYSRVARIIAYIRGRNKLKLFSLTIKAKLNEDFITGIQFTVLYYSISQSCLFRSEVSNLNPREKISRQEECDKVKNFRVCALKLMYLKHLLSG